MFRSGKRNWIAATGLALLPAAVWGQACPVIAWEYASGDDQHYEVFETDQDARQIYRTRWSPDRVLVEYRDGTRQWFQLRADMSGSRGIFRIGCVDDGVMQVRVTDCGNGRPVVGATVSVELFSGLDPHGVLTGAEGEFRVICDDCPAPKDARFNVRAEGYAPQSWRGTFSGQRIDQVEICLTRPGAEPEPTPASPPQVSVPEDFDDRHRIEDPETGHAYALSEGEVTWSEARAACESQGGHLATLTSVAEQALVSDAFGGTRAWLGGTDELREGDWRWITGEPWQFEAWNDEEPNDSGAGEDYLQFDGGGNWNDDGLPKRDRTYPYICEWEIGRRPVAANFGKAQMQETRDGGMAATTEARAVVDWATGHGYARSESRATWANAMNDCKARGGHLATITSAAENAFITSRFDGSERIWLGGSDAMSEGSWQWVTGEPWSFSGFGEGEPNDLAPGEDYLELGEGGVWNDDGLPKQDREFYYLCEWEPG